MQYRGLLYKCSRNDFSTALLLPPLEEAPTDSVAWFDWDLEYPDDYPSAGAWQPLMDLMDFAAARPKARRRRTNASTSISTRATP